MTRAMEISYEKIVPTSEQISQLYTLLTTRVHNISHNKLPTKLEHEEFVSSAPYRIWYLIYEEHKILGSVYIQNDNSIGINLKVASTQHVSHVINFIKTNHPPLPPIKSIRRDKFFVNVASSNTEMIEILRHLNKTELQRSFSI